MSFSSEEAFQHDQASVPSVAEQKVYAEDAQDNEFMQLLIDVAERCAAYASFVALEEERHKIFSAGYYEVKKLEAQVARYVALEEPVLAEFIDRKQQDLDRWRGGFEGTLAKLDFARQKVQQCSRERRRVLNRLYGAAQRFINRYMSEFEDLAPGIDIDRDFCDSLANLKEQNEWVRNGQMRLKEARKEFLGATPPQRRINSPGPRKRRQELLTRYQRQEAEVKMECESQVQKEQAFFLDVVHPLLRAARILPKRDCSMSLVSSEGLSPIDQDERQLQDAEPESLVGDVAQDPIIQQLLNSKAVLAKAIEALETGHMRYAEDLAEFLFTFTNQTKEYWDYLYEAKSDGRPYEFHEAQRLAAVQAAEQAYERALQQAREAGITELPPSPRDTGPRSDDGKAGSEQQLVWAKRRRSKNNPATKNWLKRVAKSGSPLDPSTKRPGAAYRRPRGNVKPNWGFIGESEPRRTRIDRYKKHQEAMGQRAQEQEEERVRRNAQPPTVEATLPPSEAPAPAPLSDTPPPPMRRRCVVL